MKRIAVLIVFTIVHFQTSVAIFLPIVVKKIEFTKKVPVGLPYLHYGFKSPALKFTYPHHSIFKYPFIGTHGFGYSYPHWVLKAKQAAALQTAKLGALGLGLAGVAPAAGLAKLGYGKKLATLGIGAGLAKIHPVAGLAKLGFGAGIPPGKIAFHGGLVPGFKKLGIGAGLAPAFGLGAALAPVAGKIGFHGKLAPAIGFKKLGTGAAIAPAIGLGVALAPVAGKVGFHGGFAPAVGFKKPGAGFGPIVGLGKHGFTAGLAPVAGKVGFHGVGSGFGKPGFGLGFVPGIELPKLGLPKYGPEFTPAYWAKIGRGIGHGFGFW